MLLGLLTESHVVLQKKVASRVGPVLLGFILFVVVGSGIQCSIHAVSLAQD
jgi:hypothetical protein